jgi:hypothetical protein
VFAAGGSDRVVGTGVFGGFKMSRDDEGKVIFGDKPKDSKDSSESKTNK